MDGQATTTPATLADVQRLRAEKPRKFDALVCEHVMGWHVGDDPDAGMEGQRCWLTADNDRVSYFRGGLNVFAADDVTPEYLTPLFHADPAADYATLARVREWPVELLTEMRTNLFIIVQERDGRDAPAWWDTVLNYRPGDWSCAALATVLEARR